MNDDELTNSLRGLATGVRPPADAAEQIQRGIQQRRRRRTSWAAAASVLVLVGGGTAAAQLLGASSPETPSPVGQPSPSPSTTEPAMAWEQQIPSGFSLVVGMPKPDGVETSRTRSADLTDSWALDPCEDKPEAEERSDYLSVTQQGLEQLTGRQLAVYEDDAAAKAVVEGFRTALAGCPTVEFGGGGVLRWNMDGPEYAVGDESFAVWGQYEQDGMPTTGAVDYAVVRVGNAVVVAEYAGEFGAGTPELVDQILAEHRQHVTEIAEEMCVFAEQPCS